MCFLFTLYIDICKIACPNIDIIRTNIYDLLPLKKQDKFLLFLSMLPTNVKKLKNQNLVAYFEKSGKNVKHLQIFLKLFEFFSSWFDIVGQK